MDESECYWANDVLLLALGHLWDTKDGGKGLAPQDIPKKDSVLSWKNSKNAKCKVRVLGSPVSSTPVSAHEPQKALEAPGSPECSHALHPCTTEVSASLSFQLLLPALGIL